MGTQATSTKASILLAVGLAMTPLGCDGSELEDGRATTEPATFPESSRAAFRVAELAKMFPVLGAASPARFREVDKGRIRAEVAGDETARVTLPAALDGSVELEDIPSRLGIRFARIGAGSAPLGVSGGLALYSNTDAPVDDIHRVLPVGVEDFVAFAERPPVETLSYRVEVTRVAGLRLVNATLEFLDASGTPRLRVAPPYFMDRTGKRHPALLGVDGCRIDTDPRGPWGRPTVAPGAATCVVSVRWKAEHYPILVDPLWTTTGNMAVGRTQLREAPLLPSGRVLVAGGIPAGEPLRLSEIYDPTTGTFADTGALGVPRGSPGITVLPSGKILITGGWGGGSSWHASAEIYDEDTGEWTTTSESMSSPRQSHSQNLLLSGKVLIAGGSNAGQFLSDAELFDPADESFTLTDGLNGIRSLHTGTLLSNGDVLIAGGENTETAELYDHTSETFSMTGPMSEDRGNHAAVSLGDRKVLVVGGWANSSGMETAIQTAEIYDAATGMFSTTGTMAEARRWPTATVLDSGLVLVVGGSANNTVGLASAELFEPMEGMFSSAMGMTVARLEHAATRLMNGSVVVIGGMPNTTASAAHRSASLYQDKSNGSRCGAGNECHSTFCVEGVCCESACSAELTCVTGECVDGGSGAGGDASGGSSGNGTGGRGGSSSTGGSATGGSSGSGATSGGSSGTGGDARGGDTGAGGDDSGGVCTQDADCAAEYYCNGDVCVPRTPLESACGCNVPGRRVPSGTLLACALLGAGIVLRRRCRPLSEASPSQDVP